MIANLLQSTVLDHVILFARYSGICQYLFVNSTLPLGLIVKSLAMRHPNHFFSHTAHQSMGETGSSVGAHDDKIGIFFFPLLSLRLCGK